MEPNDTVVQGGMSEEEFAHAQEKACGERVSYALKKFGCDLRGRAVITNGNVQVFIDIVKIPPDVLKQIKEAEKRGQPGPGFTEAGA
jgi:hypothetical protein